LSGATHHTEICRMLERAGGAKQT